MELRTISTGSKGNCYILEDKTGSMLMLDCGVNMQTIYKAIGFNVNALSSCLVSHVHMDHAASAKQLTQLFILTVMSKITANALGIELNDTNLIVAEPGNTITIGNWIVKSFETFHDAPGSLGYLIENTVEDIKIAYITDTGYIRYTFPGLNILIAECNFEEATIEKNREEMADRYLRVRESHMSLERLLSYLSKTDKSQLRKIILVHLSDNNSTESTMTDKVKAATGVDVYAANEGQVISLDRTPF